MVAVCADAVTKFSDRASSTDFSEHDIDLFLKDLRESARTKKAELVRHHVEMTIGIPFTEFKTLPSSNYLETWNEIRGLTLGADLLFSCAPSADAEPIIIRLDRWGMTHWESHYAAIGEGSEIARAFLCLQPWDSSGRHMSGGGGAEPNLGQCLYRVYEAKRAAHTANPSSVGRATGLQVLWNGERLLASLECIEMLETAFELKHNVPGCGPDDDGKRYLVTPKESWFSTECGEKSG
jgi:hypothetical protein